jgi:hypothetical protein
MAWLVTPPPIFSGFDHGKTSTVVYGGFAPQNVLRAMISGNTLVARGVNKWRLSGDAV